MRWATILHFLRIKYIIHYVGGANRRLISHIVLEKEIKVFGQIRFIMYQDFAYKLKTEKMFYSDTDLAIAHRYGIQEPLDFVDTETLFKDSSLSRVNSAQEQKSALESKVVLDLNKSIYDNIDRILLMAVAIVGVVAMISLYMAYKDNQLLTALYNYFVSHATPVPNPTG